MSGYRDPRRGSDQALRRARGPGWHRPRGTARDRSSGCWDRTAPGRPPPSASCATILQPDGGHAEVLGYDVVNQAPAVRRRIGLAGQYAAVDANLTGRENLKMVGILGQMPTPQIVPRAAELLEKFELTDAADRPLRTYSGGMRRRLDIAASLVTRPPVLFLDEPTTGLDLTSRNALWETIEQLVADGTTVMLTTQYLEEADRLAERIAVVDGGLVIANDTPTNLKSQLGSTVVEMRFEKHDGSERAADPADGQRQRTGRARRRHAAHHVERRRAHPDRRPACARCERHRAGDARRPRTESGRCVPVAHRPPRRGRRTNRAMNRSRAGEEARHEHCPGGDRAGRRRSADPDGTPARHGRGHQAEPAPVHPRPAAAGLLDDPADHLRADVPVRLRRIDQHGDGSRTWTT